MMTEAQDEDEDMSVPSIQKGIHKATLTGQ
jgi:hypothetical protein